MRKCQGNEQHHVQGHSLKIWPLPCRTQIFPLLNGLNKLDMAFINSNDDQKMSQKKRNLLNFFPVLQYRFSFFIYNSFVILLLEFYPC